VEDALHATRAAVEEGIVPGGGVALLRASAVLEKLRLKGDEQIGAEIVRRALEEPVRQIVQNAGEEGSVIVQRIREEKGAFGYNADSGEFEDLLAAGIIDPKKVTRNALENASSIAALLITTEAVITEIPEEEKAQAGMPGGMPPGGMGGMGGGMGMY